MSVSSRSPFSPLRLPDGIALDLFELFNGAWRFARFGVRPGVREKLRAGTKWRRGAGDADTWA
jgi:hypothetical protein